MAKETYYIRDLLNGKKRPAYTAKETCVYGKRDLLNGKRGKPAVVARAAEPVREHGKICIFFHFFSFFLNNMGRKSEPYYY